MLGGAIVFIYSNAFVVSPLLEDYSRETPTFWGEILTWVIRRYRLQWGANKVAWYASHATILNKDVKVPKNNNINIDVAFSFSCIPLNATFQYVLSLANSY